MSDSKRESGQRPKKRKFTGNCHTRIKPSNELEGNFIASSTSSKKLKTSCFEDLDADKNFVGYRIVDINTLFSEISKHLCCKICGQEVKIVEKSVCGLSSKFFIHCFSCNEISSFQNCPMMGEKNNVPEINARFIYAMRCIANGWAGMNTFCSVMDLPPPVQKATYSKTVKQISCVLSEAADISMQRAASDEMKITGQSKITVSGDGSWKTRGHSSQIGMTSVVGAETGKVLDLEVMSSYCRGCMEWKGSKSGSAFENWETEHKKTCIKNHTGSAGKMEVDGMLKIFQRSEKRHNVQYINYIGDGDTKTFLELQKSDVYGAETKLTKIECVGHVQKRMGNRLRQLKKNMQGKKLEDGKVLSGKGRLTDKMIDQLTVYYGGAIRNNKESLMDMRKAIWAIYFHKRSCDDEPLHDFCPGGENSWCSYQRAKAVGEEQHFKHKNVIPAVVMDCVKDTFKNLSDPVLLKRCLGGRTQNCNESFNSLVWKFCPKTSGSSRIIADLAANEAAVLFNEGRMGRVHVMKLLGFKIGEHALNAAAKFNKERLDKAENNAAEMCLHKRRAKHMLNYSKLEAASKKEGCSYKPGNF